MKIATISPNTPKPADPAAWRAESVFSSQGATPSVQSADGISHAHPAAMCSFIAPSTAVTPELPARASAFSSKQSQPTPALDALTQHIATTAVTKAFQLEALRTQVVDALSAGASHVVVNTSFLFPASLCESARAEMTTIPSSYPCVPERDGCYTTWGGWIRRVITALDVHEPRHGRGVLCDVDKRSDPGWHVDPNSISAICPLVGPGTEFSPATPEKAYDEVYEVDPISIQSLPRGHTMIFRGSFAPPGLVHRIPPGAYLGPRALLVF